MWYAYERYILYFREICFGGICLCGNWFLGIYLCRICFCGIYFCEICSYFNRIYFCGKIVFRPRTGWNAPVSPIGVIIVKLANAIAWVLEWMKIWAGRGQLLGRALPLLFSPLFPLLGVGLLLRCVEAAATVGSWPPQASHRASAAFTMAAAIPWAPAPTRFSHGWRKADQKHWRKRSLSGGTPGGRCCLSFPIRTLGLRPCISTGRRAIQSRTATCSIQTVQAKYFLKSRTARQSRYRHQEYPKCPEGLAWVAG